METETLTKEQRELQKRADFISGLRQLADAFESRPNMEIPEYGLLIDISTTVYTYNPEYAIDEEKSRKKLAALTRAIPGKKEKVFKDYGLFWVERKFDGPSPLASYCFQRDSLQEGFYWQQDQTCRKDRVHPRVHRGRVHLGMRRSNYRKGEVMYDHSRKVPYNHGNRRSFRLNHQFQLFTLRSTFIHSLGKST